MHVAVQTNFELSDGSHGMYASPADQLHATQQGLCFQYSSIHLFGVLCGWLSVSGRCEALLGIAKIM
jgi:hypothetical protein